ncbi:hypothetical protein [Mycolicibacterium gilvum]|uniref:Uncharacterized protein n=1 Tax=Mycolicibacterium gilvum TaxID=1804 RepID=A0A378SHT4_9MYCO|nr:hypothetical protein [Mycolicibacterium gilvum]MCV7056293.1 hypothetical protein [Mycolicibacterium gilvum]STZ41718.1 Uncharacterised protein [Mycolicibacterium gilvum]
MSDTTDTTTEPAEDRVSDATPEGDTSDATAEGDTSDATAATDAGSDSESDPTDDPDTFPRHVVEDLRKENGRYRQRAQQADAYAHRLHLEMVKATGRLADPTDLEFDEAHLDDPETLAAAIDDLLGRKPHLATRKPSGDIGQGHRGGAAEPFSLLGLLKERT